MTLLAGICHLLSSASLFPFSSQHQPRWLAVNAHAHRRRFSSLTSKLTRWRCRQWERDRSHMCLSLSWCCREGKDAEAGGTSSKPATSTSNPLGQAELVLGVTLNVGLSTSAHSGILEASALASQSPLLFALPPWLKMPSKYKQHWIRYLVLGIGASYASLFFIR